jgi:hypothetical protein
MRSPSRMGQPDIHLAASPGKIKRADIGCVSLYN